MLHTPPGAPPAPYYRPTDLAIVGPAYFPPLHLRDEAVQVVVPHDRDADLLRCVVDEYGDLLPLGCDARLSNRAFKASTFDGIDEAAYAQHEAERLEVLRRERAHDAARRFRLLARPEPIGVEVDELDDNGPRIRIDADQRLDAPTVYIDVPHEAPLRLTRAQLAALLVAAEPFAKPVNEVRA